MRALLLDVNVVLDALLNRRPHAGAAVRLWAAIERGRGRALIPAHGVITVYYLLAKGSGTAVARSAVSQLIQIFGVAGVDETTLRRALALGWDDFEDAVCAAAAEINGCQAIVTRDAKGFVGASLPVLDAVAALGWLTAQP